MARMPSFEEVERDAAAVGRGITGLFDRHHAADAAPETPAAQPVNLAPATASAATPQEDSMSIATLEADLGNGVAAVKAKIAEFEQNLPGIVAEAKQFAASPLGQLAVTAATHVAAGILPPEALAVVESGAAKLYSDIFALYNPQGAQQAPAPTVQQPVVPAPAQ